MVQRLAKKQPKASPAPVQPGSGFRLSKTVRAELPKGNILYLQQLRERQRKTATPRVTLPVEFLTPEDET